jgi:hypothetical protein
MTIIQIAAISFLVGTAPGAFSPPTAHRHFLKGKMVKAHCAREQQIARHSISLTS